MAKAELLKIVEENQPEHFLSFWTKYTKKRLVKELQETLCELNRAEVNQVWTRLYSWIENQLIEPLPEDEPRTNGQNVGEPAAPSSNTDKIVTKEIANEEQARHRGKDSSDVNGDDQSNEAIEGRNIQNSQNHNLEGYDVKLLVGIIDFTCMYVVTVKDVYIPNILLVMVRFLHETVNALEEELQTSIARLCEKWWTLQLDQHERLISNVLPAILKATLRTKVQKTDVARLWSVREAVELMELSNPECAAFTEQLVLCASATVFLSCDEGIKWLAQLLMHPTLLPRVHKGVKTVLPTCTKQQSAKYAEVYFRAWKNSQGEMKKNIEENYIQDLMYAGIHVDPYHGRLSTNLHHFLHQIHRQKRHAAVSTMIYTLYQPILWRSLKVPNGFVRMNATGLLCDAFPLSDAALNQEERGDLMERQYQELTTLLTDPCHLVRITAVKGVFNILSNYWLMVPSHIIKAIFQKLLKDLIYDASSSEVRLQVVKGLTLLLDSSNALPFLIDVLPRIGEVFDDPSASVRAAFVKMLLKVKASKVMRYWDIVKVEHLLHRLEEDNPTVCKLLTQLVLSSFHPTNTDDQELLQRCLSLLEENRAASRRFYQYASRRLDIASVVHFMLLLWRYLMHHVRMQNQRNTSYQDEESTRGSGLDQAKGPGATERSSSSASPALPKDKENYGSVYGQRRCLATRKDRQLGKDAEDSNEGIQIENERSSDSEDDSDIINEDDEGSPLDNPDVIGGLLDTVVILWMTNAYKFALPHNEKYIVALRTRVAKDMPILFKIYKDDEIFQTLLYLSSFLPRRMVPTLVGHCLSRIKTFQADQDPENIATYINALCNWNRADDILELASEWLEEGLKHGKATSAKERRKSQRGVRFRDASTPQPLLALRLVQNILQHPLNKLTTLEKYRHLLLDIMTNMAKVKDVISERVNHSEELSALCSDKFICECWGQYLSLVAVLHNLTPNEQSAKDDEDEESDGEHPNDLLFDSCKCVGECWDWATSTLLPKLEEVPEENGGKRKSCSNDEARTVIVDVLRRLMTASTHIMMTGAATNEAVHTVCSTVETLVRSDTSGSFWQKSLGFSVEAQKFLKVYESNFEAHETSQLVSPVEVVESVISAISQYAKHNSFVQQDKDMVSSSLLRAVVLFGQESRRSQQTLITHMVSTIIDHLSWVIDKTHGVDLEVKKVCDLEECVSIMVGVCQGRAKLSSVFMEALTDIISNTIYDSTAILAGSYLVKVLAEDSGKISRYSLKQAVLAIDSTISKIILPNSTVDDVNTSALDIYENYGVSSKKILRELKNSLGVV